MVTKPDRYEVGRILLGAKLRDRRAAAGLTLAGLAERAGVSVGYLSDLERGQRLPALDKLDGICRAVDTDVVSLLEGVYPWGSVSAPRSVRPLPDGRARTR